MGAIASAGITLSSQFIAALPPWMDDAKALMTWLTILGGCFGMVYYLLGMHLDLCKKYRDHKDAARKELHEIRTAREAEEAKLRRAQEDAVCKTRLSDGICPMLQQAYPELFKPTEDTKHTTHE